MPNQRAAGQKLLNFPAKEKFITEIDRGVEKSGLGDRSKFVREAIVEKLERLELLCLRKFLARHPGPAKVAGRRTKNRFTACLRRRHGQVVLN